MTPQDYLELLREASRHPLAGVTNVVPGTRLINTVGILTGGGALSADLTLTATVSPNLSTAAVGIQRTIAGTGLLTVNGGASHDFSADITLAHGSFAGTTPGLVPVGTSDGTKFLSQLGWAAGTVVGVSSLSATAPVAVSAATGAVNISIPLANIAASGIVPATGGADATKSLIATNPISWGTPGAGAFVRLQATTPGTQDIGHSNISGTGTAARQMVNTQASPLGVVHAVGNGTDPEFFGASYSTTRGPSIKLRRSRGTESSPAVCADTDELGAIVLDTRLTSSFLGRTLLGASADGAGGVSQDFLFDLFAGATSDFSQSRFTKDGVRIESARPGTISTTKPKSTLDLIGSLGLKLAFKTAAFTADADNCVYYIDGSGVANPLIVTLPNTTSAGPGGTSIANRVYAFIKVEPSFRKIQITAHTGQFINGLTVWELNAYGEAVTIICDGSNWHVLESDPANGVIQSAIGTAVVSTAAETTLVTVNQGWNNVGTGMSAHMTSAGKLSTTGAPTLRFKVKNLNDVVVADSGAVTMPSGVTNVAWQLEVAISDRDGTSTGQRVSRAILHVSQTAGVGASMNAYNMLDVTLAGALDAMPYYITVQWGTSSASNTVTCIHSEVRYSRQNLVN